MDSFIVPNFESAILGIAQAYGPYQYWTENLLPGMNPDATWRALMIMACLKDTLVIQPARRLLNSKDSRVRSWACFALGQLKDETSLDKLVSLNAHPSRRVRVHAWAAIQSIRGVEEKERIFHAEIWSTKPLILISEDSERMRENLSNSLIQMGFRVKTASSEVQTTRLAYQLKPDAIITDNQKGRDNLSGLNMTWDICRKAALRETILFMLTMDEVEPAFLWSGGDYFLSKKRFSMKKLVQLIQEYMVR